MKMRQDVHALIILILKVLLMTFNMKIVDMESKLTHLLANLVQIEVLMLERWLVLFVVLPA
jgi:hypothetical protein